MAFPPSLGPPPGGLPALRLRTNPPLFKLWPCGDGQSRTAMLPTPTLSPCSDPCPIQSLTTALPMSGSLPLVIEEAPAPALPPRNPAALNFLLGPPTQVTCAQDGTLVQAYVQDLIPTDALLPAALSTSFSTEADSPTPSPTNSESSAEDVDSWSAAAARILRWLEANPQPAIPTADVPPANKPPALDDEDSDVDP